MRDQRLYNIYKNIKQLDDPMYKYISFYLEKDKSYKHFLELYRGCIELLKNDFPFDKINRKFFRIAQKYNGNDETLIWDFFFNLYVVNDYDLFADFLSNISYSYVFLKEEDELEEANPEFYKLFKAFTDILENIASYITGIDAIYMHEIACSLFAVAWIDGTNDYDQVYSKIKNLFDTDISISDFCLVCGIDVKVMTTEKSIFIVNEIPKYIKTNRVER